LYDDFEDSDYRTGHQGLEALCPASGNRQNQGIIIA